MRAAWRAFATREGVALYLLGAGLLACVVLLLPRGDGLNRYMLPKELAFHVTALVAGAVVLLGSTRARVGKLDAALGTHLVLTFVAMLLAMSQSMAWRASGLVLSMSVTFWTARTLARQERRQAIIGVVALATLVAAMTVLLESFGVLRGLSLQGRAPGGTTGHRNFMAHFLTLGLAPLGIIVLGARQRLAAGLAAGATALTTMAIVLSLSRAAWLGMAAGIAATAVASLLCHPSPGNRTSATRKAVFVGAAVLGMLAAVFIPTQLAWRSGTPFADTLHRLAESDRGTGRGRLIQYRSTLELIRQHPVFGVGPGNWSVAYPAVAAPGDPSHIPTSPQPVSRMPNSDWLGLASERGVPALLLIWATAALLVARSVRRLREAGSQEEILAAGALLAVCAMIGVMGTFDAVLLRPEPAFLMSLSAGALVSAAPGRDMPVPRWFRYGGALALTLATLFLASRLKREMEASYLIATSAGRAQTLAVAAQRDPENYRVHAMLAMAYSHQGDCVLAREHAMTVLALYPHHAGASKVLTSCASSTSVAQPKHNTPLAALLSQYPMPVSVSPDGSRVLVKTRGASDFEIAVLDRKSGGVLHKTRSSDTQLSLSWRPDGKAIAFTSSTGGNRQYRLSIWDLLSGEVNTFASPLTFTAAPPIRWAPDGRSLLLYVGNGRAGELKVLKTEPVQDLEGVSLARVSPDTDYRWSPDGSRIAYIPAENESSIQQLQLGASGEPELLALLPPGSLVRDLSWSADGQALLFSAREPGEKFFSLRMLELRTRQLNVVARNKNDLRHPVLLKDQQRFLYEANEGGIHQLWLASVNGRSHRLLGHPDESHLILGLSAEGGEVYTVRSRMNFPPDLVAVSVASGELSVVAAASKQPPGIGPLMVTTKSHDGLEVPLIVWAGKPADPNVKPRAIINVHGGPHLQELPLWDARTQYLLGQGMMVASVNYRGSKGYGADFERHEDVAGQAQDVIAAQRYLSDELGVPVENISLLASSSGTRVAVHAAFLKPESFGRLILTSTVPLDPRTCPQESGLRSILAFHGLGDNIMSPSLARDSLGRCFGEASFDAGTSRFNVFDDEGHHFHRSRSWAEILSAASQ